MKHFFSLALLALATTLAPTVSLAHAQEPAIPFPKASPKATLKEQIGMASLEIEYSRPSVKGRKVFGELVPYGEVWRTGANDATKLTFGADVTFWQRDAAPAFTAALDDFLQLTPGVQRWHDAAFESVLQGYRKRFEATGTEEGDVMAATLAYVIGDLRTSRRAAILEDFRSNGQILQLFRQGAAELGHLLTGSH